MSIISLGAHAKAISNWSSFEVDSRMNNMLNSSTLNEYCKKAQILEENPFKKMINFFSKKLSPSITIDEKNIIEFIKKFPHKKRYIGETILLEKALAKVAKDMEVLNVRHLPNTKGIDELTGKQLPADKRIMIVDNKPYTGVIKHEKHTYMEGNCIEGPYTRHKTDYTFGIYENGKCISIEKFMSSEDF